LGSKSQVTLYKGHLGVGVTEPSGQLELAGDERLQEYPPRGMTGYETLVEGHGVFKVYSTGGLYNNGSGGNLPWTVFNKITGTFNDGTSWVSEDAAAAGAGGNYNNDGSSGYGGSHRLSSNTPLGDYLVICLPYSIVLKSYSLSNLSGGTGYGAADFPRDYIIYGSNDDVNWEVVDSRSDQEAGGLAPAAHVSAGYLGYTNNYTVSENNKVYSKFAIVITDLNAKQWYDYTSGTYNASYAGISEWRLFGTPGPTTLDKGSLTLGRSLDVPRISRYDVDTETPRPEKLVVDYDTTVNSSPTDISGQGNHGTLVGATYSAADKAFSFDGGDYIQGSLTNSSSDFTNTVSLWFKMDDLQSTLGTPSTTGNRRTIFEFGDIGNRSDLNFGFVDIRNTYMTIYMGDTATLPSSAFAPQQNQWHHLVLMYSGSGTLRIFIDNTDYTSSLAGVVNGTLAIQVNADLLLGSEGRLNAAKFRGDISNFKIYSVALEPSEVQKLYRLGRTGRSMVISDTAVGIGKVPEAQLDVRGNLAVRGDIQSSGPNFEITSSGFVGIGKNPGHLLDVNGTMRANLNYSPQNWAFYDTIGSDTAWRTAFSVGSTAIGFFSVLSYNAGFSQSNAIWYYQYKSGGTSGGVVRITGSSSPTFRMTGQTVEHNGNGGTHFTQLRVLPFII
jgi:hypothetical protein